MSNLEESSIQTIRVTAVGDESSDKTPTLLVFKGDPYPEDYEPTIFENYHGMHIYQGKQFNIHLWDTAGQEEYDRLRPMSYAKTDVILILFALNDPNSLKNVTDKWINEVTEYCPNAPIILIGTKSELWSPEKEGQITQGQIEEVAKKINAYKTITCSPRKNENMCDIFELAIEAYLAQRNSYSLYDYCNIA